MEPTLTPLSKIIVASLIMYPAKFILSALTVHPEAVSVSEVLAESPVNTVIRFSVSAAFGKVKIPIVSAVLLVALIVKLCVWHTFRVYVESGVVEVKDVGRN